MDIANGTFTLTEQQGTLTLRTAREGLGARAGHDLALEATRWRAVVQHDGGRTTVEAEIDPRSLEVRSGTGGVKPLSDKDRGDIKKDLERRVLEVEDNSRIAFSASSPVEWAESSASPESARGVLEGDLELHGRRAAVRLDVELQRQGSDLHLAARASLPQSRWGIEQYRGFMGALKVADTVEAELQATVPGA